MIITTIRNDAYPYNCLINHYKLNEQPEEKTMIMEGM